MSQPDSPNPHPNPQAIFFDAVGTLFGVKGSVGDIYGAIAQEFGVDADAQALNRAFAEQFQAAPPMAFPGIPPEELPQEEYRWWENIACLTFSSIDKLKEFQDFSAYFRQLYDHFKTAEPWEVYADVIPSLSYWRSQGIELGIISNFDSRLHAVLHGLKLDQFFRSVTISSEAGAAKPSEQIFQTALQKHNCPPERAWHIGDSLHEDYQAATSLGIHGIWIKRP